MTINGSWKRWRMRRMLISRTRSFIKSAFASAHPEEEVSAFWVRAVEEKRVVFAVIIKPPGIFRGMPPYRLIAVSSDLSRWEELPKADSPYRLKGIK